ncbi:MAG TPA: hypothetical protein VNT51_04885 [Miltoncostaeaceae bacterium]|nr:hypothetical protein [Miltoncostaeaceae bacterium]
MSPGGGPGDRDRDHRPALRPGYLVVQEGDDGGYVGGLMVTDGEGLPRDFRYTDPITPTRLQRVLYGGALDRHLRADVVAGTLLAALEERPTVLLVEDETLLAVDAACPVALVDLSRAPALGPVGTVRPEADGRRLVQVEEGSHPLRVTPADPARADETVAALVALGEAMDPLEPAERVRAALGLIATGAVA